MKLTEDRVKRVVSQLSPESVAILRQMPLAERKDAFRKLTVLEARSRVVDNDPSTVTAERLNGFVNEAKEASVLGKKVEEIKDNAPDVDMEPVDKLPKAELGKPATGKAEIPPKKEISNEKPVQLESKRPPCETCDGTGKCEGAACPDCKGGHKKEDEPIPHVKKEGAEPAKCDKCGGTGTKTVGDKKFPCSCTKVGKDKTITGESKDLEGARMHAVALAECAIEENLGAEEVAGSIKEGAEKFNVSARYMMALAREAARTQLSELSKVTRLEEKKEFTEAADCVLNTFKEAKTLLETPAPVVEEEKPVLEASEVAEVVNEAAVPEPGKKVIKETTVVEDVPEMESYGGLLTETTHAVREFPEGDTVESLLTLDVPEDEQA